VRDDSLSAKIFMIEKRQLFNTVSALRHSDLKQKVSLPKLKQELRRFKLSSVIVALAQINTLIAPKNVNPEDFSTLTEYLVDNYIDPSGRQ
jgi:predicted nucleic acid-binding protein